MSAQQPDSNLSEPVTAPVFASADKDHNGSLSKEEFLAAFGKK